MTALEYYIGDLEQALAKDDQQQLKEAARAVITAFDAEFSEPEQ